MTSLVEGAGWEDVGGPTTAGEGERSGSNPPLTGTRVLDVSTVYAAPITGMLLGDFGADVIKIEHPQEIPRGLMVGTTRDMACGTRSSPATSAR